MPRQFTAHKEIINLYKMTITQLFRRNEIAAMQELMNVLERELMAYAETIASTVRNSTDTPNIGYQADIAYVELESDMQWHTAMKQKIVQPLITGRFN